MSSGKYCGCIFLLLFFGESEGEIDPAMKQQLDPMTAVMWASYRMEVALKTNT